MLVEYRAVGSSLFIWFDIWKVLKCRRQTGRHEPTDISIFRSKNRQNQMCLSFATLWKLHFLRAMKATWQFVGCHPCFVVREFRPQTNSKIDIWLLNIQTNYTYESAAWCTAHTLPTPRTTANQKFSTRWISAVRKHMCARLKWHTWQGTAECRQHILSSISRMGFADVSNVYLFEFNIRGRLWPPCRL